MSRITLSVGLSLVLFGCAAEEDFVDLNGSQVYDVWSPADAAVEVTPPPATLTISGACPGPVTLDITDLTPGGQFGLLSANGPGSGVLGGGPCPGLVTGLGAGLGLQTAGTASAFGTQSFNPTVSGGACGKNMQVLDVATCTLSNVDVIGDSATWTDEWDVTPPTGDLVEGDDPYWAEKGWLFTANSTFTMVGGAWWINMPADGYVRMRVYENDTGALLAEGAIGDYGDGTEQWYEAFLTYTFVGGEDYLVTFYTNRSGSSIFDRKNSPSYGYTVGEMTGLTHWAGYQSGDDAVQVNPADGFLGNTWAPFQKFYIQ